MNATGPTTNSGRTATTDASTSPMIIICLRDERSATHPKNGSPTSRAAGQAATTMPEGGQVHAVLGEVDRQDRQERAEAEPDGALGEEERQDRAPAVEPGVEAVGHGVTCTWQDAGGAIVADRPPGPPAADHGPGPPEQAGPMIRGRCRPSSCSSVLVAGLLALLPVWRLHRAGWPARVAVHGVGRVRDRDHRWGPLRRGRSGSCCRSWSLAYVAPFVAGPERLARVLRGRQRDGGRGHRRDADARAPGLPEPSQPSRDDGRRTRSAGRRPGGRSLSGPVALHGGGEYVTGRRAGDGRPARRRRSRRAGDAVTRRRPRPDRRRAPPAGPRRRARASGRSRRPPRAPGMAVEVAVGPAPRPATDAGGPDPAVARCGTAPT